MEHYDDGHGGAIPPKIDYSIVGKYYHKVNRIGQTLTEINNTLLRTGDRCDTIKLDNLLLRVKNILEEE